MKPYLKSYFPRMGGKSRLVKLILPYFPTDAETYVEPFIGGGSMFLSKEKHAPIEVINDLDKDIYDLWNDLPFITYDDIKVFDYEPCKDTFYDLQRTYFENPIGRFYRNMFISKNSWSGNRKTCGIHQRHNKLSALKNIDTYKNRINGVNIHNRDFRDIIKEYDSPSTLFYLDPPYSQMQKGWGYNNLPNRTDILPVLQSIKGRFIMSYDYCPENLELFKEFKIIELDHCYSSRKSGNRSDTLKEILIMNF